MLASGIGMDTPGKDTCFSYCRDLYSCRSMHWSSSAWYRG